MKRLLAGAGATIAVAGLGVVLGTAPAGAATLDRPASTAATATAAANIPGYAVPGSRIRTGPRLNDLILGEVQAGGNISIHCYTEGDSLSSTETDEWFYATDTRSGITGYIYGEGAGGTTEQIIPRC